MTLQTGKVTNQNKEQTTSRLCLPKKTTPMADEDAGVCVCARVCLCVCLCVCVCVCVCVCLSLSLSLSLSLPFSLSPSLFLSPSLSPPLPPLTKFVSYNTQQSWTLSCNSWKALMQVSKHLFVAALLLFERTHAHTHKARVALHQPFLSLSPCLSLSLSVCLSPSLKLSLSLCLSQTLSPHSQSLSNSLNPPPNFQLQQPCQRTARGPRTATTTTW